MTDQTPATSMFIQWETPDPVALSAPKYPEGGILPGFDALNAFKAMFTQQPEGTKAAMVGLKIGDIFHTWFTRTEEADAIAQFENWLKNPPAIKPRLFTT